MAWDKGFNFRETFDFVADGANTTYVLPSDAYLTNRNGVPFGWTVNPSGGRDRDGGINARVAGICFGNGNGTFRVDLPAPGVYAVSLAMGDAASPQTASKIIIKDNVTTKLTIGPHDVGAAEFYDATDTLRASAASWVANQTSVNLTFASTTLLLSLEAAGSNSVIAHLFLSEVAAARRFILGTH
jgi:hypothetical protein